MNNIFDWIRDVIELIMWKWYIEKILKNIEKYWKMKKKWYDKWMLNWSNKNDGDI